MDWCREHNEGFELHEKGCPDGQICCASDQRYSEALLAQR